VVRARSIFRKAETSATASLAAFDASIAAVIRNEEEGSGIWELWVTAAKTSLLIEQCIATAEPAYLAKHAFQLAQQFNNFYHRHHIMTEKDAAKKQLLLATAAVAERELVRLLACMGVHVPEAM
jgi:arginyl-tRNA synthetase